MPSGHAVSAAAGAAGTRAISGPPLGRGARGVAVWTARLSVALPTAPGSALGWALAWPHAAMSRQARGASATAGLLRTAAMRALA